MKLAVYGSLRRGDYNHVLIKAEPLSTEQISGFEMYDTGMGYPYIVQGDGQIIVEVYELSDKKIVPIWNMEIGAGYQAGMVSTSAGKALIFYQIGVSQYDPPVIGGDWIKYNERSSNGQQEAESASTSRRDG